MCARKISGEWGRFSDGGTRGMGEGSPGIGFAAAASGQRRAQRAGEKSAIFFDALLCRST
jgi:hypothetical protein